MLQLLTAKGTSSVKDGEVDLDFIEECKGQKWVWIRILHVNRIQIIGSKKSLIFFF